RTDSARCEDHFSAAMCAAQVAVLPPAHAGRALAIQFQTLDQTAGFKLEVLPVQHRLEKPARRRPSASTLLIDVEVTDTLVVAGVEILDGGIAVLVRRRAECVKVSPVQPRMLAPPFAAARMMLAFEKMIDVLAKVWPHIVP